ncbi:MAG: YebC/PmpR family DNA-binding transcriptional regulator [Bacteroidetes bacterium]|nr:YebC/PmpR family DNA-binding transcriptional regulator [Bacteroidota bacterium]
MGRSFEKRKHKIFGRNAKISKMFTKYGKEISMAVKAGGADPSSNTRLRTVVQNAKGDNMPKDRIEAAIHRASSKQDADFQEVVYEGYGPYGIAIVVETATDNPTRTVANIRMYFNRAGGNLGTSGSLDFLFQRKAVFKLAAEGMNPEDLELELIDFGAEEVVLDEDMIYVYTAFEDFGAMQQGLEEKGIVVLNASTERIPVTSAELSAEQQEEIGKLIERFEEDDDVTGVFHNLG